MKKQIVGISGGRFPYKRQILLAQLDESIDKNELPALIIRKSRNAVVITQEEYKRLIDLEQSRLTPSTPTEEETKDEIIEFLSLKYLLSRHNQYYTCKEFYETNTDRDVREDVKRVQELSKKYDIYQILRKQGE